MLRNGGKLAAEGRGRLASSPAAMRAGEVLARLGSRPVGLTADEALHRLRVRGANVLETAREPSRLAILVDQIRNVPTSLLLGSSAVSSALRDFVDAGAILSVVGLNAALGYRIERKSEQLLASWRRLEAGQAVVLRGGSLRKIAAADLVVGDVILCRAGDTVPADARIIDAHRLSCDEALLTGESEPRSKSVATVRREAPLAERTSMLYAGTSVVSGHGRAVVSATGPDTEAAHVRRLVEEQEPLQTPLERRLDWLGRRLAVWGVGAGAVNAVIGLLRGRPMAEITRSGVALAVAAIPEGLPVVSTAALVRSMQRMRARGMVVRRLASAETLGGVTVVCADKTGTLTRNEMTLEVIDCGNGPVAASAVRADPRRIFRHGPTLALAAAVLNSDVDSQRRGTSVALAGTSTERALVAAAHAAGLGRTRLGKRFPRRLLRERDGGVQYVVSLHESPGGGTVAFVKGAPEQVLDLCDRDLRGRLTARGRRSLLARNEAMAGQGLRVLALAWRRFRERNPRQLDRRYTLIGLVGLRDPLRPGAAAAVRLAANAGIRTVMLTGDQRRTAEAIARAVGLSGDTVDGPEVARLLDASDRRTRSRIRRTVVFSRVTPEQKVAIVRALRAGGDIVAMAGDGINDAPALKAADVGVAIGIGSNDLARQAADVVLESEDLASILSAVGEGRIVQDNLRRALRFLLATNLAEVASVLGAQLIGGREAFNPRQLLWINMLSDTLPALALALEPGRPDVLDRPPMRSDAPLVTDAMVRRVVRDGSLLVALSGAGMLIGGRPVAFATLCGAEIGYAFACRSSASLPNGRFLALIGAGAGLQVAALTLPPLRALLGLPLAPSALEWLGFAAGVLLPGVVRSSGDQVIVRRGSADTFDPARVPSLHRKRAQPSPVRKRPRPAGRLRAQPAAWRTVQARQFQRRYAR